MAANISQIQYLTNTWQSVCFVHGKPVLLLVDASFYKLFFFGNNHLSLRDSYEQLPFSSQFADNNRSTPDGLEHSSDIGLE